MRVALAQINSTLGDFKANREKIVEFTKQAIEKKCDLVVFPELAIFGYLPNDLLERDSIIEAQLKEFEKLKKEIPSGIGVLVGLITRTKKGKPYYNSAALLERGKAPKFFHKQLLPTYDIFDESRYFESGKTADNILRFKGKTFLITICEDIWGWGQEWKGANYVENPLTKIKGKKIDLVLNLSASPFTKSKRKSRLDVVKRTAKQFKAPMIYVNMAGSQDEVVFDGGSVAIDAKGKLLAQNLYYAEDLNIVDFKKGEGGLRKIPKSQIEFLHQALVSGIRDFVEKNGFKRVHLGISGGIDSAVVLGLAVDAVGSDRVSALALPGPHSSDESFDLAEKICRNLGVNFQKISILGPYEAVVKSFESSLGATPFGVVHENIQARLRGIMLMAFGNREHSLLLTTGNKSEYAAGYTTLYGDMCGGLAPIGDLLKNEVYALAELFNRETEVIPQRIIDRAPTAELRPNQTDQDTLPPYDRLDRAVEKLVEKCGSASSADEKWLLNALFKSEFKRWQAPPILKVSSHAFGRGRRIPITNKALF